MSYLVLARKYRPRRFAEMVGQEHVVQALGNALAQQRLHHAYLFTGTRGVGKTTVSRIFAKSVNCTGADGQGGITAEPCGVCAACRDIDAGRFVDYIELDAASNRGVDEISQLLDQSVYKPVVGRFKVYMIDEVHMLSTTAFNAMLKTLEEPPEYLKFVLATTDPQKVPATVLSRCLQFNLRPMAPETVVEHLGKVLADEAIAAEPGALRLLARSARGSMRDALSLTDQAIAYSGGQLQEAGVRQMLGAVDRRHAADVVQALAASDGTALVAAVDTLRAAGLSATGLLEDLSLLAQQMAVLQAVPAALDASDPDAAVAQHLAGLLAPDETQLLYSLAVHGRAELALAPDEYSGLVMVLLRLLAFRPGQGSGVRAAAAPASSAALRAPAAPAASVATSTSASMPAAVPAVSTPRPVARPQPPTAAPSGGASAPRAPVPVPASASMLASVPRPATKPPAAVVARPAGPSAGRASSSAPPWEDGGDEPPLAEPEPADRELVAAASDQIALPSAPPRAEVADTAPLQGIDVGRSPESAPALVSEAVPASTFAPDPLTNQWVGHAEKLMAQGALAGLVREIAWQAQCIAWDEASQPLRCVLRVERESLRQPSHVERLRLALIELLGQPVALSVEAGPVVDSAARRDAANKARAQRQAEHTILNDPTVQALIARFPGAAIVPGSIRPV